MFTILFHTTIIGTPLFGGDRNCLCEGVEVLKWCSRISWCFHCVHFRRSFTSSRKWKRAPADWVLFSVPDPSWQARGLPSPVFVFSAIAVGEGAAASPCMCIPNNSFHPLTNVNCHLWFMFINQNGKCMWSAESGSRLLSGSVINHYWLAFPVKLHREGGKDRHSLPWSWRKEAGAKRLAF